MEDVLASSARYFPQILESVAGQQIAQGRALEAQGAFDLVFDADGFDWVDGFYDGRTFRGRATQPLRPLGAEIYTQYRISDGDFPIYQDENFTNTGGALKVGALFSLLRDRSIDQRRFGLMDTRLGIEQADLELLLTKIGVQQRALLAYWRWVTFGRQLKVYQNLLDIAEVRQNNLQKQVDSGALADIFLTENMQNIMRRRGLVTAAERDLKLAANALSLFYRDAEGTPIIPDSTLLPPGIESNLEDDLEVPGEIAATNALYRRPELAILRTAIEREQNRIKLSENNLKPRIDLEFSYQQGELGSVDEGGISRDSNDTIVGFQFSVPLQRSQARGQLMRARAELERQASAAEVAGGSDPAGSEKHTA